MSTADELIAAAKHLSIAVSGLRFGLPVTHVYNPLDYARRAHEIYLRRYANSTKRIIFLGMNPGPFGMAQTGIPFGQIAAVRDWLGITAKIDRPRKEIESVRSSASIVIAARLAANVCGVCSRSASALPTNFSASTS